MLYHLKVFCYCEFLFATKGHYGLLVYLVEFKLSMISLMIPSLIDCNIIHIRDQNGGISYEIIFDTLHLRHYYTILHYIV